MNELKIFEGHEVEVFELNGQVLFNPYHVGACLDIGESGVKTAVSKMNKKQVVKLTNSKVAKYDFRKLHNTGENFLTESGVYKLVFKSHKPNAEAFTDWIADEVLPSIRKTGSYETPKAKAHAERLASVNNAVKILTPMLEKAGVDDLYIAVEVKRLYTELGYEVKVPLITDKVDMPKLYDCAEIAKELGIFSTSGNPHVLAVSAIIQKLQIEESEIVTTAFSRNGHDDVTIQYKPSVFEDVKLWLAENNYPVKIIYANSKGKSSTCSVVYREVA